jgi:hypothetical protein
VKGEEMMTNGMPEIKGKVHIELLDRSTIEGQFIGMNQSGVWVDRDGTHRKTFVPFQTVRLIEELPSSH